MSMAMRYLAQPWFMYRQARLSTELTGAYHNSLDTLVRQSHPWHSFLCHVAV